MSPETQQRSAPTSRDPEAEQEVDFSRYARLLVARWWLLGAGLVAGAILGWLISLGGTQVYSASATIYLGQPISQGGGPLQTLQTNPSAVTAIVHAESVMGAVAAECKTKPGAFRGGISTQPITGNLSKNGQNPIVELTVTARKEKVAACAANGLANKVVEKLGRFADQKVANFRNRIATDVHSVNIIKAGLASAQVSTTDKLLFQLQLRNFQDDEIAATQLLAQAQQVEVPHVLTTAASTRVTARSRRNTVVVAALIGLVLGALLAFFWDRIAPRLRPDEE